MKKTLIAIAALAATSAFAQSSVTMSGRLDAGYGSRVDTAATGVKTNVTAIQYGGINTPFLGLGGTEDLGGGLKAGFYVETALMNATTLFGDRGQYLTLEGGFGKITAGTQNTGARDILIGYDAGGAINVAGSLNSSTGADAGHADVGSHTAFSTGVKYTTPTYNGLTLAGSFSKNNTNYSDTAADTRTGQGYSYGGNYVNGPLSVGVSYSNAVTTTVTTAGTSTTLAKDITGKVTAAGASYDLGMAKLYVAHFKYVADDAVSPTGATSWTRKSTTYGIKAPLTARLSAFASVGTGTLKFGSDGTFTRDLTGRQLGAVYELSKRTSLKAAYGTTKSDVTATTDTKVKETAVALVHVF